MDTQGMILGAFYRLLETQSFDSITTQAILDEAGVSRSTFYRHFCDKYDVMNTFYSQSVDRLMSNSNLRWLEGLRRVTAFIHKHGAYFTHAAKTRGANSFFSFLYHHAYDYYRNRYLETYGEKSVDERIEIAIVGLAGAHISMMRFWIETDYEIDSDELADLLYQCIPKSLSDLFE